MTISLTDPVRPEVDFIVSNPPFLGGKKLRTGDRKNAASGLGDEYVEKLFAAYRDCVPAEADLCCYWFEKARQQVEHGKCKRAGLLATQAIRGGANRKVLKRIKKTGDIFFAESDREWILAGANVHVSMVGPSVRPNKKSHPHGWLDWFRNRFARLAYAACLRFREA